MLPKTSQRVAEVFSLANTIAHEYDQEYVGTEHMLMAIEQEGTGVGATVLANRGVTKQRLQEEVDKLIKSRMEDTWVFGRLPGTPHFKNVMATAIDQCQALAAPEVCTEHLLLALVKERGSVAGKALVNLGLGYDVVRQDILDLKSET